MKILEYMLKFAIEIKEQLISLKRGAQSGKRLVVVSHTDKLLISHRQSVFQMQIIVSQLTMEKRIHILNV